MRRFPVILMLLFTSSLFAQTAANSGCPGIDVSGPSGLVDPGETGRFTVQVEKEAGKDVLLEYVWSVSSGEIVSGQGTSEINVKWGAESVTATVKVRGLPEGCRDMGSENQGCGLRMPEAQLIETFRGRLREKDRTRFDKFVAALEADRNAKGIIFFGGTPARIKANKRTMMSLIPMHLGRRGPGVTLVDLSTTAEFMELWVVPAGAKDPEPSEIR